MRPFFRFLPLIVVLFSFQGNALTVGIDPTVKNQVFEGWGTSICWWGHMEGSGYAAFRNRIAEYMIDPDSGLGYTIFRYNIGGGDQPGHTHIPAGRAIPGYKPTETGLYNWAADPYQRNMVAALVQKARDKNTTLIWEAFSNSPPWWMTISGCAAGNTGGADNLKPAYFTTFADYLTEVVKHFRDSLGITFRTLEPFNEPSAGWWTINNNQEGCGFKMNQPLMVKDLGRSLVAKGLFPACHVSAADENALDSAVNGLKAYDDTSLSFMSQINTHGYGNRSTTNLTNIAASASAKQKILWMSESGPLNGLGGQDITMLMSQYIIQDLRIMKPKAWIDWQSYGAGTWGNFLVDSNTLALVPQKRYYMHAAFSRYLRPGSQFIQTTDSNTVAALVPSTGNLVIVSRNGRTSVIADTFDLSKFTGLPAQAPARQFLVSQSTTLGTLSAIPIASGKMIYTLPAQSVTTFIIPGMTGIQPALPAVRRQEMAGFSLTRHAIGFSLKADGAYEVTLFTVNGRALAVLRGMGRAGANTASLGGCRLTNGIYLVRLRAAGEKRTARMKAEG